MRLVYLGTPQLAVPPLDALVDAGHHVRLVVTGADKRRGRGSDLSPSPVKQAAMRLGIPVTSTVDDVLATDAELGVVVAFGRLIKPHVLERIPMVNLHFSLLPRWRGAAPVERALLAGDAVTGVCLMAVEEGLDTGAVYARREVAIAPDDTVESLRAKLVDVGVALLIEGLANGLGDPEPQHGDATYAAKISPAELRIDWQRPAGEIDRTIRVGGAWTTFRGSRVKIHAGRLEEGRLVPTVVQPEGKPRMDFEAWCNGARPAPGEWFE